MQVAKLPRICFEVLLRGLMMKEADAPPLIKQIHNCTCFSLAVLELAEAATIAGDKFSFLGFFKTA